jgi:mannosyltransferase OCH1-like enzyme
VALYQTGGYYFDVDIQVLKPLIPETRNQTTTTTFITSWAVGWAVRGTIHGGPSFFQAVLCVTPKHPIIAANIQSIIDDWYYNEKVISKFNDSWYQNEEQQEVGGGSIMPVFNEKVFFSEPYQKELKSLHPIDALMGPSTLWIAWQSLTTTTTTPVSSHWLLEEMDMRKRFLTYPNFFRQETAWGCNFIVHDPNDRTPYFYSRCRGSPGCPYPNHTVTRPQYQQMPNRNRDKVTVKHVITRAQLAAATEDRFGGDPISLPTPLYWDRFGRDPISLPKPLY